MRYKYSLDDVTATDGSCLKEIKPKSEIKEQDGQSLSSQNSSLAKNAWAENPDEELVRHSEYHHPRASKVAAAMTAYEATRSAVKNGHGEKKMTLAELAKLKDGKKVEEDDPNPKPSVPILITDDDVETSPAKDDENDDSLVRHSEFYRASRSPKPVRRKFNGAGQLPLSENSENRRPTLVDILQKNKEVEGNDDPSRSNSMLKEDLLGSRESIYSNTGLYSNNSVSGEIMFGYQYTNGTFKIKIFEARGLMAIDEKKNTSDPYAKVYLLPDQSRVGKRKTKTKHGTIDPEFNEEMLYKISSTELLKRTIWITLWHYDRFGRNEFLGEIRIPLGGYNGSEEHAKWYTLLEMLPDSVEEHQGELVVALMYAQTAKKKNKEENTGKLYVKVVEARDLPGKDSDNLSDPFCKSYLLPDPTKKTKKKTPVLKRNLNPHWDHKFTYHDLTLDELRGRVLELTVWDYDLGSSNDFLGGVRIGLGTSGEDWDDCEGEEVSLWKFLLSKPNTWTQNTLSLRSQMGSRKGLKISS